MATITVKKGLIGKEDLSRNTDGTTTFTRKKSDGTSQTLTKLNLWQDNVFNVMDYGATGDGSTDDTQAFKDAIRAAIPESSSLTSGEVVIPYTTSGYLITGPLFGEITGFNVTGFAMRGVGGMPVLKFQPTTASSSGSPNNALDLRMTSGDTWYNCQWENFELNASDATQANVRDGIYYTNLYQCEFKHLRIVGFNNTNSAGAGGGSCGVRGGGYDSGGGNYMAGNDQQSSFELCWIANNTIGMIVYDGTMEWNRCFFQANEKVQAHCSTGQFHFDKCWFYVAPAGATATILVTGGGTCAIEGCKFHKTAGGPADIRFTVRPSGGPAVGAKPEGPLRTWLPEPASGSATYTRNVTVANCIFDEAHSGATAHDGSKAHIVFGEADAPSTNSFNNGSIIENQFSMFNATATPFGSDNDYAGNVPIYIYDGADARGVEISRNITVNYTGNAALFAEPQVVNSRAIFKVENNPGSSNLIVDSADWEDVTLDFHYRRTDADDEVNSGNAFYMTPASYHPPLSGLYTITNLTADRAYNANGTTDAEVADVLGTAIGDATTYASISTSRTGFEYASPGLLMYRGMDIICSEQVADPGTTTWVKLYINNALQEISDGYTGVNLNGAAFTINSNNRIAPFFTQSTHSLSPAGPQDDSFIQATHGQSIGVTITIPSAMKAVSGTGFDILVRTHWINRKPNQTGIV